MVGVPERTTEYINFETDFCTIQCAGYGKFKWLYIQIIPKEFNRETILGMINVNEPFPDYKLLKVPQEIKTLENRQEIKSAVIDYTSADADTLAYAKRYKKISTTVQVKCGGCRDVYIDKEFGVVYKETDVDASSQQLTELKAYVTSSNPLLVPVLSVFETDANKLVLVEPFLDINECLDIDGCPDHLPKTVPDKIRLIERLVGNKGFVLNVEGEFCFYDRQLMYRGTNNFTMRNNVPIWYDLGETEFTYSTADLRILWYLRQVLGGEEAIYQRLKNELPKIDSYWEQLTGRINGERNPNTEFKWSNADNWYYGR